MCWTKLSCLLLVAIGEILAVGGLVRPLGAEGRVGQHHVEPVGRRGLVDRVAQDDLGLQAVQEEVHQGQPPRPGDQVLAVVGLLADPPGRSRGPAPRPWSRADQPLVGGHQKAARAAGRVADGELPVRAGVGLHAADDGLDQHARA